MVSHGPCHRWRFGSGDGHHCVTEAGVPVRSVRHSNASVVIRDITAPHSPRILRANTHAREGLHLLIDAAVRGVSHTAGSL